MIEYSTASDLVKKNIALEADDDALIEGSCLIKSCTLSTSDLPSTIIPPCGLSFISFSSLDGISSKGFPSLHPLTAKSFPLLYLFLY